MGRSFRAVQEPTVNRRQFVQGVGVAGLGLLAGCGRLLGQGQLPATGAPRIGFLYGASPQLATAWVEAFQQGLREHGYVDGQNIAVEYRSADGRYELLADLAAELVRLPVDVIVAAGGTPTSDALFWREAQDAASALGVQLQSVEVRGSNVDSALETAAREPADALMTLPDPIFGAHGVQIAHFATRSRLPSMHAWRTDVETGGLMAYGPSLPGQYRRAAYYVDRILKGTRPADLPVEQPREFEFVINLKTARELSLTIPQHVLMQATEVIQ